MIVIIGMVLQAGSPFVGILFLTIVYVNAHGHVIYLHKLVTCPIDYNTVGVVLKGSIVSLMSAL